MVWKTDKALFEVSARLQGCEGVWNRVQWSPDGPEPSLGQKDPLLPAHHHMASLADALQAGDTDASQLGKRTVLCNPYMQSTPCRSKLSGMTGYPHPVSIILHMCIQSRPPAFSPNARLLQQRSCATNDGVWRAAFT